jgi:hypothetical protein
VLNDTTARARSVCFSISASMFVYAERPVSFRGRTQIPSATRATSASASPRLGAPPRARSADIRRSAWPRVSKSQSCTSRTSGMMVAEVVLACARVTDATRFGCKIRHHAVAGRPTS